jgi:hypothetical protein
MIAAAIFGPTPGRVSRVLRFATLTLTVTIFAFMVLVLLTVVGVFVVMVVAIFWALATNIPVPNTRLAAATKILLAMFMRLHSFGLTDRCFLRQPRVAGCAERIGCEMEGLKTWFVGFANHVSTSCHSSLLIISSSKLANVVSALVCSAGFNLEQFFLSRVWNFHPRVKVCSLGMKSA